mmetsp:Transcript_54530/g.152074  ORF Transcript_54530/g.152074 Transcript_54530/m.152074 type:complete len:315 (+) Transcript_54530:109-1053(+)
MAGFVGTRSLALTIARVALVVPCLLAAAPTPETSTSESPSHEHFAVATTRPALERSASAVSPSRGEEVAAAGAHVALDRGGSASSAALAEELVAATMRMRADAAAAMRHEPGRTDLVAPWAALEQALGKNAMAVPWKSGLAALGPSASTVRAAFDREHHLLAEELGKERRLLIEDIRTMAAAASASGPLGPAAMAAQGTEEQSARVGAATADALGSLGSGAPGSVDFGASPASFAALGAETTSVVGSVAFGIAPLTGTARLGAIACAAAAGASVVTMALGCRRTQREHEGWLPQTRGHDVREALLGSAGSPLTS